MRTYMRWYFGCRYFLTTRISLGFLIILSILHMRQSNSKHLSSISYMEVLKAADYWSVFFVVLEARFTPAPGRFRSFSYRYLVWVRPWLGAHLF